MSVWIPKGAAVHGSLCVEREEDKACHARVPAVECLQLLLNCLPKLHTTDQLKSSTEV